MGGFKFFLQENGANLCRPVIEKFHQRAQAHHKRQCFDLWPLELSRTNTGYCVKIVTFIPLFYHLWQCYEFLDSVICCDLWAWGAFFVDFPDNVIVRWTICIHPSWRVSPLHIPQLENSNAEVPLSSVIVKWEFFIWQ